MLCNLSETCQFGCSVRNTTFETMTSQSRAIMTWLLPLSCLQSPLFPEKKLLISTFVVSCNSSTVWIPEFHIWWLSKSHCGTLHTTATIHPSGEILYVDLRGVSYRRLGSFCWTQYNVDTVRAEVSDHTQQIHNYNPLFLFNGLD